MPGRPNPNEPSFLRPIGPCQFRHSRDKWKHVSHRPHEAPPAPSSFTLITWNIEYNLHARERTYAALRHLQQDVLGCDDDDDEPEPCVILLQEISAADAFDVILDDPWIREWFTLAPLSPEVHWPPRVPFGLATLVTTSIPVKKCASLTFGCSEQGRFALMVDVKMTLPPNLTASPGSGRSGGRSGKDVLVRIVNTHLESLGGEENTERRSIQLSLIGRFMTKAEDAPGIYAAVLGGDLNAIDGSAGLVPEHIGLKDACRLPENDPRGFTWGFQLNDGDRKHPGRYPPGRLDRILYTKRRGFRVKNPDVIAKGVTIDNGEWVSDHFGLVTDVIMN